MKKKYIFQKNVTYTSGRFSVLDVPNGENIFDIIYGHSVIRKEISGLFEDYNLKLLYNSADKKFSIFNLELFKKINNKILK